MSVAAPAVAPDAVDQPAAAPASRPAGARSWAWPAVVTVTVTTLYVTFSAWQWSRFTVKSWDLGIFTELLQRYAALQAPIVPIKGDGYNLLGDHFHPLLALLGPVYALYPSAFTLLVVQAVCFGVAAGVLTRTARRLVGPVAGVLLGLAFGLSWGLQYAVEAQFHEIAVAVPLLTVALCGLLEERWRAVLVGAGLLVLVKEDLGLTVAVIGVVLALRSRDRRHLWLSVWGVGWVAVTFLVVFPLLNPSGAWGYAGTLSPFSMFTDPAAFFDPSKGHTLVLALVTSAGIALRSPLALVLLPTLAWRFLSGNEGYWGPTWHYSAVLMPILFAALVDGIRLARSSPRGWLRAYGRQAAAVAVTVAAMLQPTLPLRSLVDPAAQAPAPRAEQARAVLAAVPDGVGVESDIGLMSYLVDGHQVSWTGNANPVPDCILIDLEAGGTPDEWGDVLEVADRLHPGSTFHLVYDQAGYQLACGPGR